MGSSVTTLAQFGPQQVISTETLRPYQLMTHDMDNDGYTDVMAASRETYELHWYRNIDGLGTFGDKIVINSEPANYLSIDLADMDGDGDDDIIFHENYPNEIKWMEHLDGQGAFAGEAFLFTPSQGFIMSTTPGDIDNDGDMDILVNVVIPFNGGTLLWLENEGGGSFSSATTLKESSNEYYPPMLVDIDNDGDLDILTSEESYLPSTVIWYENTGGANYNKKHIIHQFDYFASDFVSVVDMNFADVNSDGFGDILIRTYVDFVEYQEHWIESINGNGSYGVIDHRNFAIRRFYDLDNDNDLDVLNGYNDDIFWQQNTNGQGIFDTPISISTKVNTPTSVRAADINGDGYLDVISASSGDNKLAWYPNNILAVADVNKTKIALSPNPTTGRLTFHPPSVVETVKVYNLLGQQVAQFTYEDSIDISDLPAGAYLVLIVTTGGTTETVKILKQ